MRKHFLLLFLMAILPFYGWAAEPSLPANAPVYSGAAQDLIVAGDEANFYYYYTVVADGAGKPAAAAYTLAVNTVPQGTHAANYDVYYVKKATQTAPNADEAAAAVKLDASIAKRALVITFKIGNDVVTNTDYTGAVIVPTVLVDGNASAGYNVSWSSEVKNAGSYTVTVQTVNTVSSVDYVDEEGTADFLVNKVPLSVNAKHVTITYGDAAVENNALYTATGWKGTDATNPEVNNLVVNVNFGGLQPTNAGVHPFTITAGTVNNYNVIVSVANANLTIEKKKLTIQAKAGAGFEYGEVTSYAPEFVYTGLLPKDANSDGSPKDGVLKSPVTFTALTADPEPVNFFNTDGSIKGNAGTYVITPVVEAVAGVQSDNYELDCKATNGTTYSHLVVAPKSLTHSHVTISPIPDQEYANATLTPVIKITDSKVYGSEPKELNPGTDYTVTWSSTPLKAAGTYTATFGAGSNGNYTVPSTAPTKTFKINPAPLTVVIKTKEEQGMTKVFDGNEFSFGYTFSNVEPYSMTSTDAQKRTILQSFASIYGVKNNEDLSTVFTKVPVLSYTAKSGSKVNVNDYVVTVADQTDLSSNYDVYIEDGSLSITKMPIWIKAKDTKKTYGKAEPDLTYVVLPTAESAEGAALTPNSTYIQTAPTFEREQGENVGTFTITKKTDAVAKGNYEIKGYVDGIFTIELATLRIVAENKEQVYNGTIKEELTYKVYGLVEGDQVTGVTVAIAATANNGTSKSATGDAGIYALTASGAVVTNASTGADATDNYKAVAYQEGTYTITAKPLVVTAKPQGLLVGEKETDLDNSLVEFNGLIDADKSQVTAVLKFSDDVKLDNGAIDAIANQTEIDVNGVIEDGIEVQGIAGARAFNYDVTAATALVAGDLLITDAAEIITITPANKATWTAADEATRKSYGWQDIKDANNKKATVKFASFTMAPERWYTMVLPFKTNVADISSKLGYAVVNVLNTSNSSDEVKFKLHMQDIEANEPFLVKVYKEIDLANTDLDGNHTTLDPLTFTGKTIAYEETPSVADAKGTQFIGTFMGYQTAAGITDEYYMSISDFTWHNAKDGGYTRPSGAYLKVAPGVHARILIEEPDGTTSIHTLTANGEMVPAQGWYTLNGVKLQGVPTEKGIYINNGKKVVIK